MSIITKGLIGKEDMSLGTSTFSRTTSTGGTNILTQVDFASLTNTSTQTFAGSLVIVGGVSSTGTNTANIVVSKTANPATSGIIRLANADTIRARNVGNTQDATLMFLDATNLIEIGDSTFNVALACSTLSAINASGLTINAPGQGLSPGIPITITAGAAGGLSHAGGDLTLQGGPATTNGAGGNVNLTPGTSPSGTPGKVVISTSVSNDGSGLKHKRITTGSITNGTDAAITVTWGTTFPDANYTVIASVVDSTASNSSLKVVHIDSVNAGSVVVRVRNDAGGPLTGTLHVIAIHD